jgi:hypothetical protein
MNLIRTEEEEDIKDWCIGDILYELDQNRGGGRHKGLVYRLVCINVITVEVWKNVERCV